ncbi:MAG TPA: mechanosensitive ion channel family protein [Spirochaetia bacterium]|nr:mechanosensitive ion channel family protein [Spirochaetia bacterium]
MPKNFSLDFSKLLTPDRLTALARAAVILVIGFFVVQIIARLVHRITRKRLSPQNSMLIRRVIVYTGMTIIIVNVLQAFGFQLGALLGAAGIVGIAVGFASQTSMSNLISGLFLISEKPFSIGDVISVGSTTGIVESIDLLSIKIRRFDNQFVRIPNEKIITSELTNVTRYPIRRMDIKLGVAYKEDMDRVRRILLEVAEENRYALVEPEPLFIFTDFGSSSLDILFGLWFEKSDYLNLKNSIMIDIKKRFDLEGIEIPFPHQSLYAGSVTEPFPIRIVNTPESAPTPPEQT